MPRRPRILDLSAVPARYLAYLLAIMACYYLVYGVQLIAHTFTCHLLKH